MSGTSSTAECPKCGGEIQTYYDWKPHESVLGECLDCGFCYHTEESQMNMDEVNGRRADFELEPLTELRDSEHEKKKKKKPKDESLYA